MVSEARLHHHPVYSTWQIDVGGQENYVLAWNQAKFILVSQTSLKKYQPCRVVMDLCAETRWAITFSRGPPHLQTAPGHGHTYGLKSQLSSCSTLSKWDSVRSQPIEAYLQGNCTVIATRSIARLRMLPEILSYFLISKHFYKIKMNLFFVRLGLEPNSNAARIWLFFTVTGKFNFYQGVLCKWGSKSAWGGRMRTRDALTGTVGWVAGRGQSRRDTRRDWRGRSRKWLPRNSPFLHPSCASRPPHRWLLAICCCSLRKVYKFE